MAEEIAAAISEGRFAPGERLVESWLADTLKVSRGPVREALKSLAARGLVEIRPNLGACVASPSEESLGQAIVMRGLLEGAAARVAAVSRDAAQRALLEQAVARMRAAADKDDLERLLDEHWAFHRALVEGSGNAHLVSAWQALRTLILLYRRRIGLHGIDKAHVLRVHGIFLELFAAGDPEEAEAAVRSLIISSGFRLIDRPVDAAALGYITREMAPDGRLVSRPVAH
ncbi:GntR family transcriptional regulator [Vineibacter terrae]|uniref:GntR family transcriptional regulator n=1 Tax=Vineibacter terrae TaxID=2586908 RepID=UPI0015B499EC|nr:GntR family transcriptional regulator [Vineibacter terrae]